MSLLHAAEIAIFAVVVLALLFFAAIIVSLVAASGSACFALGTCYLPQPRDTSLYLPARIPSAAAALMDLSVSAALFGCLQWALRVPEFCTEEGGGHVSQRRRRRALPLLLTCIPAAPLISWAAEVAADPMAVPDTPGNPCSVSAATGVPMRTSDGLLVAVAIAPGDRRIYAVAMRHENSPEKTAVLCWVNLRYVSQLTTCMAHVGGVPFFEEGSGSGSCSGDGVYVWGCALRYYRAVAPEAAAAVAAVGADSAWIVGHSLGGSLAAICAFDWLFSSSQRSPQQKKAIPAVVGLQMSGAPRAGNAAFSVALTAALGDRMVNYVNIYDPVTTSPFPLTIRDIDYVVQRGGGEGRERERDKQLVQPGDPPVYFNRAGPSPWHTEVGSDKLWARHWLDTYAEEVSQRQREKAKDKETIAAVAALLSSSSPSRSPWQ